MLLMLALLSFSPAQADAPDLCAEGPCLPAQQEIQSAFTAHPGLAAASFGRPFSGSCFHDWPHLDPSHEHHGLALLDAKDGAATYRALFSFFAEKDPFAGMTYAQADLALKQGGSDPTPMALSATEGTAIFRSGEGTIQYWVRGGGDDFYLLGAWNLKSGHARTWCHFHPTSPSS